MTATATEPVRSRRRVWRRIALGIVALGLALGIYAFAIEPGRLQVVTTPIELESWPGPDLRIAVLADLHVGAPHIDLERLDDVVAETNASEPDIVVIVGDLVIHGVAFGTFVEPEPIAAGLAKLRARHGVYAVLGNHDWWYDGERVTAALVAAGITVLEDQAVRTDAGVWIAGVGDKWTRPANVDAALAAVTDDSPVVVITHNPDVFPSIGARASLTIAGHTHGGQVDVPLFGPPIVPSDFGQRYAQGLVIEDGRRMFVSAGIGTSILPVRFRVVPRIDVLVLAGR